MECRGNCGCEVLAVVGELGALGTGVRYDLAETAAIEPDGEGMLLACVVAGGGKEHGRSLVVFVVGSTLGNGVHRYDLEIALGELPLELGIGGERLRGFEAVEVNVRVAVTPAGPKEATGAVRAGFQKAEIIADVDPSVALFAEDLAGTAGVGVDEIQVDLVLAAVEHLGPDDAGINPAESGQVDTGRFLFWKGSNPLDFAVAGVEDAKANRGIGIPNLRILFLFETRVGRYPVGDGVSGDRSFVHLEEGDFAAVGRPELVATDAEFLLIDPIDLAVKDVAVHVTGVVLVFLAVHAHSSFSETVYGFANQAMLADEGDVLAVRGKLGVGGGVGARSKLNSCSIYF